MQMKKKMINYLKNFIDWKLRVCVSLFLCSVCDFVVLEMGKTYFLRQG